jgi:hypothetical protein
VIAELCFIICLTDFSRSDAGKDSDEMTMMMKLLMHRQLGWSGCDSSIYNLLLWSAYKCETSCYHSSRYGYDSLLVEVDCHFRGAYGPHHHCSDDGGSTHLWNVSLLSVRLHSALSQKAAIFKYTLRSLALSSIVSRNYTTLMNVICNLTQRKCILHNPVSRI